MDLFLQKGLMMAL